MTAPAAVSAAVAALQAQVTALSPLKDKSLTTLAPLTLAAEALVVTLDAAVPAAAGALDAPALNVAPPDMPAVVNALYASLTTQLALVQQRGLAGRVLINLGGALPSMGEPIQPPPTTPPVLGVLDWRALTNQLQPMF